MGRRRSKERKGSKFLSDKESVATVALFKLKLQEIQVLSDSQKTSKWLPVEGNRQYGFHMRRRTAN